MARRCSIQIGDQTFETKAELKNHVRAIVASYGNGATLKADDEAFILQLLERHRWHGQKVGVGVLAITVEMNPGQQRGFWLTRVDGSRTDFSWVSCIDPPSHRKDVLEAMRAAIADQKTAFRNEFFATNPEASCPLTGERLDPSSCHVDHVAPDTFESLATRFLIDRGIDVGTVALDGFEDGEMTARFVDVSVKADWWSFHRTHAKLRVLSRAGNLSLARRSLEPQKRRVP